MAFKSASFQNSVVLKRVQELSNQTSKYRCDPLLKTWHLNNWKVIFKDFYYLTISLASTIGKLGGIVTGSKISRQLPSTAQWEAHVAFVIENHA